MPRVLYCARTRPPLEPPFPLPPPPSTLSQQHMDLDAPDSPTSPLPSYPNHQQPYYEYESDTDVEECPPSPELTSASQQHMDLDDQNSPTSLLPPGPSHEQPYYDYASDDSYDYQACLPLPDPNNQQLYYDYDSDDSDFERPPSPGPAKAYSLEDECFDPYLEGVTDFADWMFLL